MHTKFDAHHVIQTPQQIIRCCKRATVHHAICILQQKAIAWASFCLTPMVYTRCHRAITYHGDPALSFTCHAPTYLLVSNESHTWRLLQHDKLQVDNRCLHRHCWSYTAMDIYMPDTTLPSERAWMRMFPDDGNHTWGLHQNYKRQRTFCATNPSSTCRCQWGRRLS